MRALFVSFSVFAAMGVIIAGLTILGAIPDALGLFVAPYVVHQQTKIVHSSQGYIDAANDQLNNLMVTYNDPSISGGQKAAIINRMRGIAARIPSNEVPEDVRGVLGQ